MIVRLLTGPPGISMENHANHDPVLSYSRRAERAAGLFPERSEVGLFFRPAGPVDGKIPPCQGGCRRQGGRFMGEEANELFYVYG